MSSIALFPLLAVVRVAKVCENGTDYSLNNTVRHSLFLPTSREAKYKAKQAIDTFFWRAGDLLQAGVSAESLARVHAPVGIDIGSQTVPEIAISILAELIAHRNRGGIVPGRCEGVAEASA